MTVCRLARHHAHLKNLLQNFSLACKAFILRLRSSSITKDNQPFVALLPKTFTLSLDRYPSPPSMELTIIFLLVIWSIPLITEHYLHNHVPTHNASKSFYGILGTGEKYSHISIHWELILCLYTTH